MDHGACSRTHDLNSYGQALSAGQDDLGGFDLDAVLWRGTALQRVERSNDSTTNPLPPLWFFTHPFHRLDGDADGRAFRNDDLLRHVDWHCKWPSMVSFLRIGFHFLTSRSAEISVPCSSNNVSLLLAPCGFGPVSAARSWAVAAELLSVIVLIYSKDITALCNKPFRCLFMRFSLAPAWKGFAGILGMPTAGLIFPSLRLALGPATT
jgi:hypothetical protein